MLIEADDTILEYLKNSDNMNAMDSVLVAINNILNSVLLRQHIFFAKLELLEYLKNCEAISLSNKIIVQCLLDKYSMIGSFLSNIENRIVVGERKGQITEQNGIYYVDIRDMVYIEKTRIIAEHGSDAEAYIHIGKKTIEWMRYKGISVEFERKSCYGSNVKDAISSCLLNRPIILCIIDSDKKYYEDDFGSTYKAASKEVEKLKDREIIKLYSPNVKEKENLYPFVWYSFVDKNYKKLVSIIENIHPSEEFLRFYDIKEGVTVKDYKCVDERWRRLYCDFLSVCEQDNLLKDSFHNLEKKLPEEVLVTGVGSETAEKVDRLIVQGKIKACLNEKISLKDNGLNIPQEIINQYTQFVNIAENIDKNLPPWLLTEWKELGKEIIIWGLCFSEDFLPRFV